MILITMMMSAQFLIPIIREIYAKNSKAMQTALLLPVYKSLANWRKAVILSPPIKISFLLLMKLTAPPQGSSSNSLKINSSIAFGWDILAPQCLTEKPQKKFLVNYYTLTQLKKPLQIATC